MAAVRLVPEREVERIRQALDSAARAALAEQVATLNTHLEAHGLSPVLSAAASRKRNGTALGVTVAAGLWSSAAWARAVTTHLEPAAKTAAAAATTAVAAAVGGTALMGMADSSADVIDRITSVALDAGDSIGERVAEAGLTADPSSAVASVLSTAGDILGDLVGALSNMAATVATNDAAVALTSLEAPEYLSAMKRWINAGDDLVRETHQDVDDVGINEYFDVGGEAMIGPGDPQASDSETLNCRCVLEVSGVVPEGSGYDESSALDNMPTAGEAA